MNTAYSELVSAILLSLGGGTLIVLLLSSFLGKLWAQRILQSEMANHNRNIRNYEAQLKSITEKHSLIYNQKIDLYKEFSEPLLELVVVMYLNKGFEDDYAYNFEIKRLRTTAHLALFAPQNVFDQYNSLLDYLYDSMETDNFDFSIFRGMALDLLSEIRKDIGIYKDSIKYNGHR